MTRMNRQQEEMLGKHSYNYMFKTSKRRNHNLNEIMNMFQPFVFTGCYCFVLFRWKGSGIFVSTSQVQWFQKSVHCVTVRWRGATVANGWLTCIDHLDSFFSSFGFINLLWLLQAYVFMFATFFQAREWPQNSMHQWVIGKSERIEDTSEGQNLG